MKRVGLFLDEFVVVLDVGEALVEREKLFAALLVIFCQALTPTTNTSECMDSSFRSGENPALMGASVFLALPSIFYTMNTALSYNNCSIH